MNRQDIINKREWRELFEALPVVQGFFGGDPDSHGINELIRNIGVYMEELLAHADDGKEGEKPNATCASGHERSSRPI